MMRCCALLYCAVCATCSRHMPCAEANAKLALRRHAYVLVVSALGASSWHCVRSGSVLQTDVIIPKLKEILIEEYGATAK